MNSIDFEKLLETTLLKIPEGKKKSFKKLKIGTHLEVLKAIIKHENETPVNINYKGNYFTIPLALNAVEKRKLEPILEDFFYKNNLGDILEVVKIEKEKAYCKNLSLKTEAKKILNDKLIEITPSNLYKFKILKKPRRKQ